MKHNKTALSLSIALFLICSMVGCGDKSFKDDKWELPGGADEASYSSETTAKPSETTVPENTNDLPTDESKATETQNEVDATLIEIRIVNKSVYINGQLVEYSENDLDSLEALLRSDLSDLSDEMRIVVDNNHGDDGVCTVVDSVINQLGLSESLIENDS